MTLKFACTVVPRSPVAVTVYTPECGPALLIRIFVPIGSTRVSAATVPGRVCSPDFVMPRVA